MHKTVWVESYYKPKFTSKTFEVPTGERGLLGKEKTKFETRNVQDGFQTGIIDGIRLQQDLQAQIDNLVAAGYDILSVTPIESGRYSYHTDPLYSADRVGYGYGYSITEGLIILAKKAA